MAGREEHMHAGKKEEDAVTYVTNMIAMTGEAWQMDTGMPKVFRFTKVRQDIRPGEVRELKVTHHGASGVFPRNNGGDKIDKTERIWSSKWWRLCGGKLEAKSEEKEELKIQMRKRCCR